MSEEVIAENEASLPVSVIVPCFNNAEFLQECIVSINSGARPHEIIIIDDNSTDNSIEVAKKLAASHNNIKLIERKENGGAAAARYDGFNAAKNNWIALVDADDFIESHSLLSAYNKVKEQNADICVWNLWRFNNVKQWPQITFSALNFPKTGRQAVLDTLGKWDIHPLGIAKKQLYLDAYSSFQNAQDHLMNADELITRLVFSKAAKVIFTESKYFYRVNINSTTLRKSYKHLSTIHSDIWLLHFIKEYSEVHPGDVAKVIIAKAWRFHLDRHYYGIEEVENKIKYAFSAINTLAPPLKWLWRYPKYLLAYLYISLAYRTYTVDNESSES